MSDSPTLSSPVDFQYLAYLYDMYVVDPASVPENWHSTLEQYAKEGQHKISWGLNTAKARYLAVNDIPTTVNTASNNSKNIINKPVGFNHSIIVEAFRNYGHRSANINPLAVTKPTLDSNLTLSAFGLDASSVVINDNGEEALAVDVINHCRDNYCGTIAAEFAQVDNQQERDWLYAAFEQDRTLSQQERLQALEDCTYAESFEKTIHVKHTGAKRFGLDGGEGIISGLKAGLAQAVKGGVREAIFGMAHRGRLSTLAHILQKPYEAIFAEFLGIPSFPDNTPGCGDVKYHMGYSCDKEVAGQTTHLSLVANPSHLEAVNTVVMGRAYAKIKQDFAGDVKAVLPVLIHGDAAVIGQGIVAETYLLSQLSGYKVGGTLHIVVNNQVGFTTNPENARSSEYCTALAHSIKAPILHINGDDVDSIVWACKLAADYRQKFHKDIVLDIVCYRRFGHNEGDEPAFTQPSLYKSIKAKQSTRSVYADKLIAAGVINASQSQQLVREADTLLADAHNKAKGYRVEQADWLQGKWQDMTNQYDYDAITSDSQATAIDQNLFDKVSVAITKVADGFNINAKIKRQLEARAKAITEGQPLDWATCEALAYGSLIAENHDVRISGQDAKRGTFSHRHAVYFDQQDQNITYTPLNNIDDNVNTKQAKLEVLNSPLSEYGVLGFDYGYSQSAPNHLTVWEAQFGDFSNGAQIMIDQFIASAESKWLRLSGLVMLLPHGYEGQGPEHSSARLERYLQLCAEENMIVANFSSPANLFHALRRQIKHKVRKPLIIMSPKSLLRHKHCVSYGHEMLAGSRFQPIIDDSVANKTAIKRLVICSGKVYYDLLEAMPAEQQDIAIIRLEQFYPYHGNIMQQTLAQYSNATEVIWCQEEPQNMGAWNFIRDHLATSTDLTIRYVGRPAKASPAEGYASWHKSTQQKLVSEALTL